MRLRWGGAPSFRQSCPARRANGNTSRRFHVPDLTPTSSTEPLYADRASGERFADATSMVNAYLARYAASARGGAGSPGGAGASALDETGYAQLQHGSATIGVNVLEAQGVLMVFSPIMAVPLTGREAFYRRLLELSFVATSDAAFAIDRSRNEVVVRCLRRLSALEYEEFEDIVTTVSQVADTWDDALLREVRGG
ncbi:hypothetical protein BE04_49175 [Sorangium cellulosum]|uniref:Tir chaperone family protein n=2 Tax=Sorangium cellulosum TaxID=56 RepID=A0A150PV34_SORCE|nr:hypothetical protein BE04_49175 [Sorangium cellulosum]